MKYLLRDNDNKYYTVVDDALQEITVTTLSASDFATYGVDSTPSSALMLTLVNPTLLCWDNDTAPSVSIRATAVPNDQVITSANNTYDTTEISGIKSAEVDGSDDVKFALSNDNGTTWKKWDSEELAWTTVSSDTDGMTATTMESLTEAMWTRLLVNAQWKLRFIISGTQYLNSVIIRYDHI